MLIEGIVVAETTIETGFGSQVRKTDHQHSGGFGGIFLLFLVFILFPRGFLFFPFLFFLIPLFFLFSLGSGSNDESEEIVAEEIKNHPKIIIKELQLSTPPVISSPDVKTEISPAPIQLPKSKFSDATEPEVLFCPYCGEKTIPNGKFCWNCGAGIR